MHGVRRVSILLVALAALVMASTAFGAFQPGFYRTKPPSSRSNFLDFSLKATSSKVTKIRYDFSKPGVCSSGAGLSGNESPYTNSVGAIAPVTIKPSGKFSFTKTGTTGGVLTVTGKLTGQVAIGTLKIHRTSAGVTCDTGNIAWRALKLG
jgi:hypothetical protein